MNCNNCVGTQSQGSVAATDATRSADAPERVPNWLGALVLLTIMWNSMAARAEATTSPGAEDSAAPTFLFSGFGTLGVVHSSEDRADFSSSAFKPTGAGFTHSWSPDPDSALGGQVIARANSQLSAIVQVVSEQQYNNSYTPYVEWANVKYQPTPDASIGVGRTVLAAFLYSVSRNVGYATPWVRQPVEVYSLVPVVNNDGIDGTYKFHTGEWAQSLSAAYGGTKPNLPEGGNVDARRQWNITDTIEYGPATLHISYVQANVTVAFLNSRLDPLRLFGPQGVALADKYNEDHKRLSAVSVGEIYDPGQWFVAGEWGRIQHNSVLGTSAGWYLSGGYRLGKFAPFLTYGELKADSNTSDPGLDVSRLPPFLVRPAMGANAALNATLGLTPIQKTVSVGARWDFMKDADFKLQYDHTRNGAGSPGTLINLQPDFQPGGTVNLFSLAVDFLL